MKIEQLKLHRVILDSNEFFNIALCAAACKNAKKRPVRAAANALLQSLREAGYGLLCESAEEKIAQVRAK